MDGGREQHGFDERGDEIADGESGQPVHVCTGGRQSHLQAGAHGGPECGELHTPPHTGDCHVVSLEGLRVRGQPDNDQRRGRLLVVVPEESENRSGEDEEHDG